MIKLAIRDLEITLTSEAAGRQRVVKGIDFQVPKGKITGIVGESGSGKTVLMKSLMGLLPHGAERNAKGSEVEEQPVTLGDLERLPTAMIFQDPMTALDPLRTIGYHLVEVIRRQRGGTKKAATEEASLFLTKVGFSHSPQILRKYPHELSGGMRQRVLIAMALLAKPEILIADEPTTALDVTIQAQILQLIREIHQREAITILFVSHDFGVIAEVCEEVKVMVHGKIVEEGTVEEVFADPRHWYTKNLMQAAKIGAKGTRLHVMAEEDRLPIGERLVPRKISETHIVWEEEEHAGNSF